MTQEQWGRTKSGYDRLDWQIEWYDSRSVEAQRRYKWAKGVEITCAALVPLIANLDGLTASLLGVAVVVLEGLQHVNQWHHNWISYRTTCEALRHERYSFLAGSGPYDELDKEAAKKLLVERVESLVSTEHSKSVATLVRVGRPKTIGNPG